MNRTEEEHKWHVNLVRSRYSYIDVSFDQAEKLLKYEETEFEFTTFWDEIERERKFMKSILRKDQYLKYLPFLDKRVKNEEKSIKSNIKLSAKQVNYLMEQKALTIKEFVPQMKELRLDFDKVLSKADKVKLDSIDRDYSQAIKEKRAKNFTVLRGHYKNLNPKVFEEWELRTDIEELIPNPSILYSNTGYQNSTKTLNDIIGKYNDEINLFLKKTLEIEQSYWQKNNELLNRHFNLDKEPNGWRIEIEMEEEESNFERIFRFLLLS